MGPLPPEANSRPAARSEWYTQTASTPRELSRALWERLMNQEESLDEAPDSLDEESSRVAADLESGTLQEMPGRFSRLIYLASLRDYNTGRYHHYGLETKYSAQAVDAGLHQAHIKAFEELVAMPLEDQTHDLVGFFISLREDRKQLIETWRRLRSYQVLPPDRCNPLARQLFDKNIEVMLSVLRETDLWALLYEAHGNAHHLP